MKILKKTIIVLILSILTISLLPVKAENNSLDIYCFFLDHRLEDLEASLCDSEENILIDFQKAEYNLNERIWFRFYIEDFTLLDDTEYSIVVTSAIRTEQVVFSFTNIYTEYYMTKYAFSNVLEDLITEVTYATFIDRKQIKFFTNYPVTEHEVNILKNDVYIDIEDYTFNHIANQYFINLQDDLDFNSEYHLELNTFDGLTVSQKIVSHTEIYTSGFFETLFNYTNNDLGVKQSKNSTTFKVWAPTLNQLTLNLYKGEYRTSFNMNKTSDGVFEYINNGNLATYEYTYSFTRDGVLHEIIDPYVKYVSNNRGLIVDLFSLNPNGYNLWKPENTAESYADSIIYESSIKKLTGNLPQSHLNNRYNSLTNLNLFYRNDKNKTFSAGLNHLKELGVTHLALNDLIKTKHSLSIINSDYRTKTTIGAEHTELKQLIKTLNENGISVILDLDTYTDVIESLELLMPGYYYETKEAKIIKEENKAFFETNHYMTNKYLESQLTYLVNEFKFQGLKISPLNSFTVDYLNNKMRDLAQDENFIFYGDFISASPNNTQKKLSSPSSLDQVRHISAVDEDRFSLEDSFLNGTTNTSLKGYVLSTWSPTYNTLSADQSFKRLSYFPSLSTDENKQLKALQLLSYGVPVIKGGEEIGFYNDDEPLNYQLKDTNNSLFVLYKDLIKLKKEHPSLQMLEHSKIRSDVVYTVKNNVVEYQIVSADDLYPHILIIHNFGDTQNITLPEGLKGYLHYNRDGEFNWQVIIDTLNHYPLKTKFDNNSEIELQKNQSLLLHFGLNKSNIIEDPIPTPEPPKKDNFIVYLLISGGLIIILGVVVTSLILRPTEKDHS
ncbi:MAG: hypothetical protein WCS22_02400 [Acholeplasmataceae bacterium]|jgi:pullulanase